MSRGYHYLKYPYYRMSRKGLIRFWCLGYDFLLCRFTDLSINFCMRTCVGRYR